MTLNQKTIDAINKAKQLCVLHKELNAESERTLTLAYEADALQSDHRAADGLSRHGPITHNKWVEHSKAFEKLDRLRTEIFATERIILHELGVMWP